MNKYVFDTSFLVSLFNNQDSNHHEAKDIANHIENEYVLVPSVVIAEIMSYIKNPKLRALVLEKTKEIMSEMFYLTERNLEEYIIFTYGLGKAFTAIDSIILFAAISTDSKLITMDKELKKLYEKEKIGSKGGQG
jgi:predicted nucleic acid-binding protein